MKLRELESLLGRVAPFKEPKVELEQYPTTPHLAAQLLHVAEARYGDISNQLVCDLGSGAGILSVGAALCDAAHVIAVDIDASAISIAVENANKFEVEHCINFMHADVLELPFRRDPNVPLRLADTVIMNPPFGTKRKGIDLAFLQIALASASSAVYSLHKSSTRDYIHRKAMGWGARPEVLAELRFDIPNMYGFHKQRAVDVDVDLWRFDTSRIPPGTVIDATLVTVNEPMMPSPFKNSGSRRLQRQKPFKR